MSDHVYRDSCDVPLLKQAAIFGPNGAGKSNLVKAMEFIRTFALDKDFANKIEVDKYIYLLKDNIHNDPIYLAIEFVHQKHIYFYEIEIGVNGTVKEGLYESQPKEEKLDLIYERNNKRVTFVRDIDQAIMGYH